MKGLLVGIIHCSECGRVLHKTIANTGKVTLQHERTAECSNAGKNYEVPAVTLKEIK